MIRSFLDRFYPVSAPATRGRRALASARRPATPAPTQNGPHIMTERRDARMGTTIAGLRE